MRRINGRKLIERVLATIRALVLTFTMCPDAYQIAFAADEHGDLYGIGRGASQS